MDALPKVIRESAVLTGNDLGLLGNVENFPEEKSIQAFKNQHNLSSLSTEQKHEKAKSFLSFSDVDSAWKVLLS